MMVAQETNYTLTFHKHHHNTTTSTSTHPTARNHHPESCQTPTHNAILPVPRMKRSPDVRGRLSIITTGMVMNHPAATMKTMRTSPKKPAHSALMPLLAFELSGNRLLP